MSVVVIRNILESLAPEVQPLHVLDVWGSLPERGVLRDGRLQPVIVFGMEVERELLRHMPGYPGEKAAAQQGVFYLSLPCSEKGLSSMTDEVKEYASTATDEFTADVHPQMVLLLRSFKHACENMKSSLRAQANSARSVLKGDPGQALKSLDAFNDAVIVRLSKEHAAIKFWVEDIREIELQEIDRLMTEIGRLVGEIRSIKETRLEEAVGMALQCATEVENMMKILKHAVEQLDHA
jgi:hypothetical protein